MTTTNDELSALPDIEPVTEVLPVIPAFPAVPAQRASFAASAAAAPGRVPTPAANLVPVANPVRGARHGEAAADAGAQPWPTTLGARDGDRDAGTPGRGRAERASAKKVRRWPWAVAGLVVGLVIGGAIGGSTGGATPATTTAAPASQVAAPVPAAVPAAPTAAPAAPAPAPAGPVTTVSDGKYQVGTDMAAGRYKTAGPPAGGIGMCYWERARNDSGQFDAIIANQVVQGPGSVTVNQGEFATLTGGCTWTRTA